MRWSTCSSAPGCLRFRRRSRSASWCSSWSCVRTGSPAGRSDRWVNRMRRAARIVLFAVLLGALLLLPRFVSSYKLLTYTTVLCLALMAQGLNFIGGYTGYAAFGNVAYFGIGAYTTGLLMLGKWHVPFFPALAVGALLSALFALLIGLPVLRLKGHYFAIATLGVAEAL